MRFCKYTIVIKCGYFILLPILGESNNTFQIVCSQSTLILRINQNGSLNCLVKELMRSENSTMGVNLAKEVNNICEKQIQKPVITVRHSISNNQTNIVEVLFRNISWQTQGSYWLSVTIGNVTKMKSFRIQVYGNGHSHALYFLLFYDYLNNCRLQC